MPCAHDAMPRDVDGVAVAVPDCQHDSSLGGRQAREIRHLLRTPACRGTGRKTANIGCSRPRWTRSNSRINWASTMPGKSSITSSRNTRTLPRPRFFSRPPASEPANIRLGHGIVQLTTNHPARVAERVATLDLVSDGRVELGLGEGASVTELHPFNLRFRDKRLVWEDAVRCTLPMFWNHGWQYDGDFFHFPHRAVVPKPLQKAAPAAMGRLLPARHDPLRRASRDGMPLFQVRQSRRRESLGARVLQHVRARPGEAVRLQDQSQHRGSFQVSCARKPTTKPGKRRMAGRSSSSPCSSTTRRGRSNPAPSISVAALSGVEANALRDSGAQAAN